MPFGNKQNLAAVSWKIVACAAFAGVNCLVRFLTGGAGCCDNPMSPDTITFFQNIFGFLFMAPFILKDGIGAVGTRHVILHALRILAAVIGIITLYSAFAVMPLGQAVALQFTGPIFTVIGAKLYLKERIGGYRMAGIVFGLVGAFIVSRPDKALITMENDLGWEVFLPLISAIMFAMAKLLSRELGLKGESPKLLAVYLLFFLIPASAVPAAIKWTTPGAVELGYLIALGACGCLAHYATAQAYCLGEVTFLTPFGFARIFFTVVLGIIIFNEVPCGLSVYAGYAIIMAGIMLITWSERKSIK